MYMALFNVLSTNSKIKRELELMAHHSRLPKVKAHVLWINTLWKMSLPRSKFYMQITIIYKKAELDATGDHMTPVRTCRMML